MGGNRIALVFPGQGSQEPGMGRPLAEASARAREVFDEADHVLGRSISRLCFEADEDELRRTANTQPALYVTCAAALAALREAGVDGIFAAGHSLGEYTALYAAGALDFATGLRLIDARGRAMEDASRRRPGTMAALLGLDDAAAEALCREASSVGVVVPANLNSPGQVVISGEEAAVARAIELAKGRRAKRAIALSVGGAFHSPLMAEAARELERVLVTATIRPPRLQFVANVDACPVSDPEAIRRSLLEQLTACVRWTDCVRMLAALGATHFLEVGPGAVLTALLKRIDPALKGQSFAGPEGLERLGEWLGMGVGASLLRS